MSAHGLCECSGGVAPGCCEGRGPAAFEVIREGKPVRLCTRCGLSKDRPTRRLLVQTTDSFKEYVDFDPLGAMTIVLLKMDEQDKKPEARA